MSLEKILADLKKGKIAPCYLLSGEEEFLVSEAVAKIIDVVLPPADRDFGLFNLDGETTDVEGLTEYILTPSLLGGTKVILVRNTTIFHSRDSLADLLQKIKTNINDNQDKAARYFMTFLQLAGFSLEDLQGAAWKNISDEQWRKIVEGDAGDDREKWLPRMVEACLSRGLTLDKTTADQADKFAELIKSGLPPGNCLILTAENVDKRKKIYKVIADTGVVLNFSVPKGDAVQKESLKTAAQQLLNRYNKQVTPAAWIALGRKTGFELRRSITELEKLVFFVDDKELIGEDDVEAVVGKTKEDSIFELTAALSDKKDLAALAALKSLLDQGMHHLMILTMIVREIRFLLQAKILIGSGKLPPLKNEMEYGWFQKNVYPVLGELADKPVSKEGLLSSQHPFVVFNALRNAQKFSYPALLGFLENLLEIDIALKTSAPDPRLLLENFLIKACAKRL